MFFKKNRIVKIELNKVEWRKVSSTNKPEIWFFEYGTISGYILEKSNNEYKWKIRLSISKKSIITGAEGTLEEAKKRVSKVLQEITESVIKRIFND